MINSIYREQNVKSSGRLYAYLSMVLSGYIFILFSIGRLGFLEQFVIWVIGPIFAFIVVISYFSYPFDIPRDVFIYSAFWIFCGLGYAIVVDQEAFFRYYRLIFSILILYFCIIVVILRTGSIRLMFKSFVVIAVVHLFYSITTGQLFASYVTQSESSRLISLIDNPNGNAYISLTGIIGVLFIWNDTRKKWLRFTYIGMIILFGMNVILTASRSGFISMIVLLVIWPIYCYRARILKNIIPFIVLVLVVIPLLSQLNDFIYNETYLGKRLQRATSSNDLLEDEARVKIYIDAFDIFLKHPIMGVGLSQYRVYSLYESIAHSDYMELLSTTGLIGFFLMFYMYYVIWRRINMVLRIIKDERIAYRLRFFKVIIITMLVFGIFKPNFLDILTMIKIGLISGYSYYLYYEVIKSEYLKALKEKRLTRLPLRNRVVIQG